MLAGALVVLIGLVLASTGAGGGVLGVGGGFVMVPALSRHTDLDLRTIQATAVIAWVSVSGITVATLQASMRWDVALPFCVGAIAAMLVGQRVAEKTPGSTPAPGVPPSALWWLC